MKLYSDVLTIKEKKMRNCDIGTVEEQTLRLRKICNKYKPNCSGCPYYTDISKENCWLKWAQAPYKKENE